MFGFRFWLLTREGGDNFYGGSIDRSRLLLYLGQGSSIISPSVTWLFAKFRFKKLLHEFSKYISRKLDFCQQEFAFTSL